MNKIEKRHLAAARRAAKRKGFKFDVPSVEVVYQEEKVVETVEISMTAPIIEEVPEHPAVSIFKGLNADRQSKGSSRKEKKPTRKEKQDAEES